MINHKTTVKLHAYIPKTLKAKLEKEVARRKKKDKAFSESKLTVEALEEKFSTD